MSIIGNEFSGLPIADLISAPLNAACDAQVRLAKATADFINTVGFNSEVDKNTLQTKLVPRQVDFSFWKPTPVATEVLATGTLTLTNGKNSPTENDEVTSIRINNVSLLKQPVMFDTNLSKTASKIVQLINNDNNLPYTASAKEEIITFTAKEGSGSSPNKYEIAVEKTENINCEVTHMNGGVNGGEAKVQKVVLSVPFLAIVNVPSLMVKTVDITFDMEVKSSESHKDDKSYEGSIDTSGKVGWGPFSAEVKVHGAVSSRQENTRSTDRSAKYHVQVQARDDGMPEGLSRVLDMLQKAITPVSTEAPLTLEEANIAQSKQVV